MFYFVLLLLITVSIKHVAASAHAQLFRLVITVGNTFPLVITVVNTFPLVVTVENTLLLLITVRNTFPSLITVGNTFPFVITVRNRFPLVITVENTFLPLITVGKNNGSSFFQKNLAHLKFHLWATVRINALYLFIFLRTNNCAIISLEL